VITIFLLAWIAVDLAAIDTCALDVDADCEGGPSATLALRAPGSSHVPIALHPDHCLCHGHTLAPDASAHLCAPSLVETTIAGEAAARPHGAASALYHPPLLRA
jgi:hypothetical protein